MAATNTFDAIVVGSGMSGGWAAKELTEKGLKTLVLERGRNMRHVDRLHHRAQGSVAAAAQQSRRPTPTARRSPSSRRSIYTTSRRSSTSSTTSSNPYEQAQPFNWYRGYHVGGRSLMWARHVFRYSDLDFEANQREGVGIDWPIRYADIAPWYEHVERFIGASGENSGLPQLPEQILQPPFEMNALEKHIRARLRQDVHGERKLICSATAVLSREHNGRGPCQGRNQCARGCPFSAYFSSNGVTLPAAAATGNLTLQPDAIVHSLIYDEAKKRVTGVRVVDANTRKTTEYFARVVFLCASTLNSTAHPAQLAFVAVSQRARQRQRRARPQPHGSSQRRRRHGELLGTARIATIAAAARPACTSRASATSRKREDKFTRGYGYEVYTSRGTWTRGIDSAEFGADFKNEITRPGRVESVHGRVWRDAAVPRQPHVAVARQDRRLGHAAHQHVDEISRQRSARWRSR